MKEIGEEYSNYPMGRTIKWESPKRSFQYYIIEEGVCRVSILYPD